MPENPQNLTPQQLAKEITRLEDEMFKAAKSLEFERAAAIRDSLAELQSLAFINKYALARRTLSEPLVSLS